MLARASEAGIGRPERLARSAQSIQLPADTTLVLGSPKTLSGYFGRSLQCCPKIKEACAGTSTSYLSVKHVYCHWGALQSECGLSEGDLDSKLDSRHNKLTLDVAGYFQFLGDCEKENSAGEPTVQTPI
jgi:hypothetical protein